MLRHCLVQRCRPAATTLPPSCRSMGCAAPVELAVGSVFEGTDSSRPPVVFVHGFLGSASNFRTPSKMISETTGRSTHAVSLRNHGDSPWSDDMSHEAMGSDVLAYLDRIAAPSAVLVGHSLGGKAVMKAALMEPDRAAHVVSVDMAPVSYSASDPSSRSVGSVVKGILAADMSAMTARADIDAHLTPYIPELLVRQFIMQNVVQERKDGQLTFRWRMNMDGMLPWMKRMLEFEDPPASPCPVPATFVSGALSEYCTPAHEPVIARFFRDYTLLSIPDAGHYVHAEKQREFVDVMVKLLKEP